MSHPTKFWPDCVIQIAFTPISQKPAAVSFASNMPNSPALKFARSTSPSWYSTASNLAAVSSARNCGGNARWRCRACAASCLASRRAEAWGFALLALRVRGGGNARGIRLWDAAGVRIPRIGMGVAVADKPGFGGEAWPIGRLKIGRRRHIRSRIARLQSGWRWGILCCRSSAGVIMGGWSWRCRPNAATVSGSLRIRLPSSPGKRIASSLGMMMT